MLTLDKDTRGIPVLAYATEDESEGTEEEEARVDELIGARAIVTAG